MPARLAMVARHTVIFFSLAARAWFNLVARAWFTQAQGEHFDRAGARDAVALG